MIGYRVGRYVLLLAFALGAALAAPRPALAVRTPAAGEGAATEEGKIEFQANDMVNRGLDLLEAKQEERGLKLIASVPEMFPKSKARFRAHLVVGKAHVDKRRFELAIKQFAYLAESEDPEEQAEALYQTGICYYQLGSFDKAFMALRKVTNEFPWSVFANESYYYIGQCHFKQNRWAKAIEALEMVGTSVPANAQGDVLAEAGQRLYVKVHDKDLVILGALKEKCTVELATKGGDKEILELEPLGRSGEYYIGSIPTVPGKAVPGDHVLQVIGGDTVTVTYIDQNTESGERNRKVLQTVQMVSTASIGFTDGAFREYTKGVFGDADCFLRVKDLDRDVTDGKDTIQVKVSSEYKVKKEDLPADAAKTGVDLEEKADKIVRRCSVTVTLTETEGHSGLFVGTVVPHVVAADADVSPAGDKLMASKGDDLVIEYADEHHMLGPDPRTVTYRAQLLLGQIQDVKIEHREVQSLDLKARKDLIEAKIFLKLGQIFKDVGLLTKATEKASEGLDRVEDVIATSLKASLDRALVEEAFSVKWELLIVQDKLAEAISVCSTLTRLFPDSTLVDKALLKIGAAKAEAGRPGEAIDVFNSIIRLPKSSMKAEAQYQIGLVMEKQARDDAERNHADPVLSAAMMAYKKCADAYPDSPYAGDSLDKIVGYYIDAKDYARAVELMERVFQDYPDAGFLDRMLLRWVVAAYRMQNYPLAKQKAEQLLTDFPNSKQAEKAREVIEAIQKMSAASTAEGTTK